MGQLQQGKGSPRTRFNLGVCVGQSIPKCDRGIGVRKDLELAHMIKGGWRQRNVHTAVAEGALCVHVKKQLMLLLQSTEVSC